jgi:hypothetical protein
MKKLNAIRTKKGKTSVGDSVVNSLCGTVTINTTGNAGFVPINQQLNAQQMINIENEFQCKLYRTIVSMGAAARHIENPELRDMLMFTALHGSTLTARKNILNVGRGKFNKLKYDIFCRTMAGTQLFIQFCRDYCKEHTNCSSTPFVSVLHDVWSKNWTDVIGVSLCFIDPANFIFYRAAIGLQEIKV